MLFALVLVISQALAIQAAVVPGDIEKLCNNKDVELTTIEQLQALAKEASGSKCPAYLKEAIVELAVIVKKDSLDLCSPDAIDTLRFYYTQYMDNASIKEDHKKQLPGSLRDFVIAYGLQMSNLCKKEMVKVLREEAHTLLGADDFKLVDKITDDDGPLAGMLASMGGADEIFLPGDLAPLMKNKGQGLGAGEKIYMQAATAPWVKRLQVGCQHRFKPLYGPLMIPLTRLSYMGFNYKDESLKTSLESKENIKEVGQWARIVLLCESLNGIHIVNDPNAKQLTEETDVSQVKIISKEEAAAVEGAQALEDSGVADLVYQPKENVQLGDLVFDKNNGELKKIVKSFKVGQSEAELVKQAMVGKGLAFLKQQLKKGKLSFMVSTAYKSLTSKDTSSPGSFMVKTLNDIVGSKQSSEGPVSGLDVGGSMGGFSGVSTNYGGGGASAFVQFLIYTVLIIFGISLAMLASCFLG